MWLRRRRRNQTPRSMPLIWCAEEKEREEGMEGGRGRDEEDGLAKAPSLSLCLCSPPSSSGSGRSTMSIGCCYDPSFDICFPSISSASASPPPTLCSNSSQDHAQHCLLLLLQAHQSFSARASPPSPSLCHSLSLCLSVSLSLSSSLPPPPSLF